MSHAEDGDLTGEAERVAAFLRALATRAARDQRFAATLAACLEESGLLAAAGAARAATGATLTKRTKRTASDSARDVREGALDPFALWRSQGEAAARAALDGLDLQELRAIVRAHRLDPARVSSRWTARERVITLIMEQVKARLNHGRAFERV